MILEDNLTGAKSHNLSSVKAEFAVMKCRISISTNS